MRRGRFASEGGAQSQREVEWVRGGERGRERGCSSLSLCADAFFSLFFTLSRPLYLLRFW